MNVTRLSVAAMRTRFEVLVLGEPLRARAAAEAAIAEIERVEAAISPFDPASEISAVNAYAAERPVRVSPDIFGLLWGTGLLHRATEGAYDPTVGPLLRLWGLRGATDWPSPDELATARRCVGFDQVILDRDAMTVRFAAPGMSLDFGAAGKGMAVATAIEALEQHGCPGLVHGGTSTVAVLGDGPEEYGWRVAVGAPDDPARALAMVNLAPDGSLSVSARDGRLGQVGGRRVSHVIDPRSGLPVDGPSLAAVLQTSAAFAEAWSTALLVEPSLADRAGHALLVEDGRVRTLGDRWEHVRLT